MRSVPYKPGGISKPASDLTDEQFRVIETALLQIPNFDNIKESCLVSRADCKLISVMLSHTTLRASDGTTKCILSSDIPAIAADKFMDEAVTFGKSHAQYKELLQTNLSLVPDCQCSGHSEISCILRNEDANRYEFAGDLQFLSNLDVEAPIRDQAGSQAVVTLLNMALRRKPMLARFFIKASQLETSCLVLDHNTHQLALYNSRPDFICSDKGRTLAVGEVESSPFAQMVVPFLGHSSVPGSRYIGVIVAKSHTIMLYWMERKSEVQFHAKDPFIGPTLLKPMTIKPFQLSNPDDIYELLEMVLKAVTYINAYKEPPIQYPSPPNYSTKLRSGIASDSPKPAKKTKIGT